MMNSQFEVKKNESEILLIHTLTKKSGDETLGNLKPLNINIHGHSPRLSQIQKKILEITQNGETIKNASENRYQREIE